MKRRYTPEEEQYLRDHYQTMTAQQIADKLGRTLNSVEKKWRHMGLRLSDELRAERRRETAARTIQQTRCPEANKAAKLRANGLVNMRIRRGAMNRATRCEQCHKPCRPDAHHDDYSKPGEVRWLCRSCHMKWHRKDDQ